MLKIYFDLAAVCICIIVLCSLIIRKLTRGRNNVLFLVLLGLVGTAGILDIITNLYGPLFPENRYTIVSQSMFNYLYFIFRNITTPVYIVYMSSLIGVWHRFRQSKFLRLALVIPYGVDLLALAVNVVKPIIFGFDDHGRYYRGDLIFILYFVALFYMCFGMAILFNSRKTVVWYKFIIMMIFLPLTAFSVVVQMILPTWRVEIVATAIMTLIIAIGVQRPEETLDQVVNAQSYNAFIIDIEKSYINKRPLSVIFIKIINYSDIRKNIGVEANSIMLRKVSNIIHRISRVVGLMPDVYYLDRGIFAIVNDQHTKENLMDAGRLGNSYLKEPVKVGGMEVNLDCMMCMVDAPNDIPTAKELINFSQSMRDYLPDSDTMIYLSEHIATKDYRLRSNMDTIIAKAIEEHNLKMYYQPIYSVSKKKFVSAEALIRLIDPEFGFVSPGIFIPAAEKSGAIHRVGEFVFDDVCRFISHNKLEEIGVDYIEINLSVAQCIDVNLATKIHNIFKNHNVDPSKVNLEITETAVDYDPFATNQNIGDLYDGGFRFSLDDYGTGYSNVSRIARLPVDIVKIDKSLVDKIDDPKMQVILKSTINMLRKMNKEILVEGVEDKQTLDKCIEMGCDYIQGYYFSKPLPEEDYLEFVRKENGNR